LRIEEPFLLQLEDW